MRNSPRLATFRRRLLWFGAAAAVVVQLGLTLAPIAEALVGQDAAAHVEAAGTSTHYAHNDATCATCQARTLHGLIARAADPLIRLAVCDTGIVSANDLRITAEAFSLNNPRAPPTSLSI